MSLNSLRLSSSFGFILTALLVAQAVAAQQLAFTSNRSGPFQIYLMNADGSGLINLSNDAWDDRTPCWSPDGQRIVFSSRRQGSWDLYVFNVAAGSAADATRLTTDPGVDICPSWSPDGQTIAFASNRTGRYAIYVMDVNGGEPTQVTGGAVDDISPAYSPDGTEIAFISNEARLGYDPLAGSGIITADVDIVHLDFWGGCFSLLATSVWLEQMAQTDETLPVPPTNARTTTQAGLLMEKTSL